MPGRRWLAAASAAGNLVADRPALWVAGGLAWAATVGPVALLAAVTPLPSVSELSFFGAGFFVSSAWPWNAVLVGVLITIAIVMALGLVSLAEVALLGGWGRGLSTNVLRSFVVTLVAAVPALATTATTLAALAGAAPVEFTSPDSSTGGPLLRTALRLAPLLALLLVTALAGAAYSSAGRVLVVQRRVGVLRALSGAPRLLVDAGLAPLIHAIVALGARVVYLAAAILLLGVLWAPIAVQVAEGEGFGAPQGALLVGFVAIWLCLVLGGGALVAWGSLTWARIFAVPSQPSLPRATETRETSSTP